MAQEPTPSQGPNAPPAVIDMSTPAERDFALSQRQAMALATSDMIPSAYQNNIPNCMIAMNLAKRTGADVLMVMQNLHIIRGKPTFSSSFLIACVNMSGRYSPLRYHIEGEGMKMSCYCWAIDKETGDRIEGPLVTMEMARAEGWLTKKDSKWKTMPGLMIRYRAATFFARTTSPEITMGLHTDDEVVDISANVNFTGASAASATDALEGAMRDVTPAPEDESQAPETEPEDETQERRDAEQGNFALEGERQTEEG